MTGRPSRTSGLVLALDLVVWLSALVSRPRSRAFSCGSAGCWGGCRGFGCTAGACDLTTGGRREGLSDGIMLGFELPRAW